MHAVAAGEVIDKGMVLTKGAGFMNRFLPPQGRQARWKGSLPPPEVLIRSSRSLLPYGDVVPTPRGTGGSSGAGTIVQTAVKFRQLQA